MNECIYKSFDELPLMLNVVQVAAVLGISRAGAYELVHSEGFPALKIGNRIVVPKDKEAAQYWFSVAEQNGHAYAGYFLDRMDRQEALPPPNILLSATRLLHHMSSIFRNNTPRPAAPTGIQIDHKRLQRLREKKMALGHKWNDHEDEQNHGMGGMGSM